MAKKATKKPVRQDYDGLANELKIDFKALVKVILENARYEGTVMVVESKKLTADQRNIVSVLHSSLKKE